MRNGRPPMPIGMHRLHGNPSKKRLDALVEPKTKGPLGPAPDCLDAEGRRAWNELQEVMPVAVLASCDLPLVTAYVQAIVRHRQAIVELRKSGGSVIIGSEGVPVTNPWSRIVDRQALLILRLGGELGLTPCARASMAARFALAGGAAFSPGTKRPGDALTAYLDRKPDRLPDPEPN
jgi:P27 family predicted phage terminase small subunit